MKIQLLNPPLLLAVAASATLFTGCASMDRGGYSGVSEPVNALAYTTITDPKDMTKWTGDRYLQLAARSMEVYYFQVPDTGYRPTATVTVDRTGDITTREAVGAPGPYQSETRSYRMIRHQPGQAR